MFRRHDLTSGPPPPPVFESIPTPQYVIIATAGVEINDLSSVIVCFLFAFIDATVLFHLLISGSIGTKGFCFGLFLGMIRAVVVKAKTNGAGLLWRDLRGIKKKWLLLLG